MIVVPKTIRQKPESELGLHMLRNLAAVMERERERRGMSKREIAACCDIASPYYLQIVEGSANPSLLVLSRISENLQVPFVELLFGEGWQRGKATATPDLG